MSIQANLLQGKLPGQKGSDWPFLYVELYEDSFHIYEGNEDPSRPRRQIRTLEINSTDLALNKDKDKKRDYRFQYERFDGKYIFKCTSAEERSTWVNNLKKMIQRKEYLEKGVLPDSQYSQASHTSHTPSSRSPRATKFNTIGYPSHHHSVDTGTPPPPPPHKRDSGFISGTGDARTYQRESGTSFSGDSIVSHGKSNSGDSAIVHNTSVIVERVSGCHSDDGRFAHRTNIPQPMVGSTTGNSVVDEEELSRYDWYWGEMSRDDCTQALKEKGKVGNFVVRKNNRGDFVMSFWRKDTVHHHRILRSGNMFQFEKSVVQASGESIPDLLDTYMKCCTDKTIGPYGGQLYPNYDDPWNPPEIDFNKMSQHLQKVKKDGKRLFKAGPGMGDHTYGGLTLEQMNNVIESTECEVQPSLPHHNPPTTSQPQVPPTNLFAGFTPNLTPSEIKAKNSKKSPAKVTKPEGKGAIPTPFAPQMGGDPNKGYVNFYPKPRTSTVPTESLEEEQFSDEDQDVYIEPGSIQKEQDEEEEEQGLYENTNFHKDSSSPPPPPLTSPEGIPNAYNDAGIYQNFVVAPPTQHQRPGKVAPKPRTQSAGGNRNQPGNGGLYANVTYDGKPMTSPRQRNGPRRKS